jgi:hypothetical protein
MDNQLVLETTAKRHNAVNAAEAEEVIEGERVSFTKGISTKTGERRIGKVELALETQCATDDADRSRHIGDDGSGASGYYDPTGPSLPAG